LIRYEPCYPPHSPSPCPMNFAHHCIDMKWASKPQKKAMAMFLAQRARKI
jgi:hypothetical protein